MSEGDGSGEGPNPCGGGNNTPFLSNSVVQAHMQSVENTHYGSRPTYQRREDAAIADYNINTGKMTITPLPSSYVTANSFQGPTYTLVKKSGHLYRILHFEPHKLHDTITYQKYPRWYDHFNKSHDSTWVTHNFEVDSADSQMVAGFHMPGLIYDQVGIKLVEPCAAGQIAHYYYRGNYY